MLSAVNNYVNDFLHLFFPHNCLGCNSDVLERHELLCAECLHKLPETNIIDKPDNFVEKIFFGRIPVTCAGSAFYYTKHSLLQQLIVQLKYKNNKEAGLFLGNLLGKKLASAERFNDVDALLPVPLFDKRLYKRGYNQAEVICQGVQKYFNKPVLTNALQRLSSTETQTHKNRLNRWQTMENVFFVVNESALQNQHVLLIDDIITTGATLEACALPLAKIAGIKISIATVGYTV